MLLASDVHPCRITNPVGRSLFLFVGDHAGNAVPAKLHLLGLSTAELSRHIALDIGIAELGRELSDRLDATFIEQRYSRLVVDCNRWPDAPDAIAASSDGTAIACNDAISGEQRDQRYATIFSPYHDAIAEHLAARDAAGRRSILVSLHSFTPVLGGVSRPWDIGVLHDRGNSKFAAAMLATLRNASGLQIGDNAPYRMDATDYTVMRHAYPSRLYVELEIRQDRLTSASERSRMAQILASALERALLLIRT
ncbi:MAG: N-formylglutamate amidohydrolase [Novosphingobium sp.]